MIVEPNCFVLVLVLFKKKEKMFTTQNFSLNSLGNYRLDFIVSSVRKLPDHHG